MANRCAASTHLSIWNKRWPRESEADGSTLEPGGELACDGASQLASIAGLVWVRSFGLVFENLPRATIYADLERLTVALDVE